MLNFMDPPRHDRLRALVSRAFTFRRVGEMEGRVRGVARELLDAIEGQAECEIVRAFAEPLPGRIIAEMIGVPAERRETFLSHTRCMLTTDPSKTITEMIEEPSKRIYEEFARVLEERRSRPAEDLMSALIAANSPSGGAGLASSRAPGQSVAAIVASAVMTITGTLTSIWVEITSRMVFAVQPP